MRILIGILFIFFLSPGAVWWAESQNRAKDFSRAERVSAESQQNGYIAVEGAATSESPVACPAVSGEESADCVYVKTIASEYVREEKIECGTLGEGTRVITQVEDRCDDSGCEPCYQVESFRWDEETVEQFAPIAVGSYRLTPETQTIFVGTDKANVYTAISGESDRPSAPDVGDKMFDYEFLPVSRVTLVAGNAAAGNITKGDDGPVVVSALDDNLTLAALDEQDKNMALGLRVFSFILMVLGFALLATGISGIFTGLFTIVPVMGKQVHGLTTIAVGALSGIIGAVVWLIVWGVVLIFKNIFLVFAVLIAIGVLLGIAVAGKTKALKK